MDVLAIDAKAELPGVDLIPDREQPFDDRGAVFCVDGAVPFNDCTDFSIDGSAFDFDGAVSRSDGVER